MSEETRKPEAAKTIRETDEFARTEADRLIRGSRHAALSVLEPMTGHPIVSRALVATDSVGRPIILVSALSSHTKALLADARAGLLFGEPGKGDPLAHPRISLKCRAEHITRDSAERPALRRRFLARHPKAELYIDFPDFSFFRLLPLSASLNGGFGKAYELSGNDLDIPSPAASALADMEEGAIAHMNADHSDAIDLYAAHLAGEKESGWRICGIDPAGFEVQRGDQLRRIRFPKLLDDAGDLRKVLADLAKSARAND
jgi:heme iron utilization protein